MRKETRGWGVGVPPGVSPEGPGRGVRGSPSPSVAGEALKQEVICSDFASEISLWPPCRDVGEQGKKRGAVSGCFSSTGEKRPLHRSLAGERCQMLRVFGR